MKKKIIFILFILLFYKTSVSALTYGGCDTSVIARMKQVVANINISYDYKIINDKVYYDVTISNLTNDIYVRDNYGNREYYNYNNGELVIPNIDNNSLSLRFNSNINDCRGLLLGTRYDQFPIFNKYYDDEVCKNMEDFLYCNKWTPKEYSYEEVQTAVKKYNEGLNNNPEEPTKEIYKKTLFDKIIDFYVKYYIVFLVGIIGICIVIILIHRKKNQFKI